MSETYDVPAAAAFLQVHRNTLLKLARSGDIPGAKIGKGWVFLRSDLEQYLKSIIAAQVNQRRAAQPGLNAYGPKSRRVRHSLPELPPIPD
jgi:excisionase family DNA binding protein